MNQPDGLLSVNGKTGIQALEAFVLLDLIGSTNPHPSFHDGFGDTTNLFQKLVKIGMVCLGMGLNRLVARQQAQVVVMQVP